MNLHVLKCNILYQNSYLCSTGCNNGSSSLVGVITPSSTDMGFNSSTLSSPLFRMWFPSTLCKSEYKNEGSTAKFKMNKQILFQLQNGVGDIFRVLQALNINCQSKSIKNSLVFVQPLMQIYSERCTRCAAFLV